MENLKELEEIIPEVKLENCKILFLDISSNCTGYSIAEVDFLHKKAKLISAGAIWLDSHWEHARKYDYLYNLIQNHFWIIEPSDFIVVEQYSINMSKRSGMLISPEAHGAIKAAAYSNGVTVTHIAVQTWRSQLGIKPKITGKEKDYKQPCIDYIKTLVNVPEESVSNITGNLRKTPSDLYEAIGICVGWLKKYNITTVDYSKCEFNKYVK